MAKSIKILMLAPLFRPLIGGSERAAERLSAQLVNQGHEVTVLAERRNEAWPFVEKMRGFTVKRLSCRYGRREHLITSLMAYASFMLLKGRQFDLFHVHQCSYHAALAILLGRILRKPVIIKTTSTQGQGIGSKIGNANSIAREPLVYLHRHADACVTTSKDGLAEVVQFGIPQERVHLIPNGVDTDAYKPCSSSLKCLLRKKNRIGNEFVVLYCGRLAAAKNPEGLLIAWRIITRDKTNAVLYYIGDGPLMAALKSKVHALRLGGSVKLVGSQNNVLDWYQMADVFVLPSRHEGLSNSLIEALSCGLPVVSTRVSGSVDIFGMGDVGELVEIGDPNGLGKKIIRLLQDPVRRENCGKNAREIALEFFGIHKIGERMEEVYMKLIKR